ncbi:hypothetical protein ACU5AY_08815 [Rhizobium sp. PAMB 3174]
MDGTVGACINQLSQVTFDGAIKLLQLGTTGLGALVLILAFLILAIATSFGNAISSNTRIIFTRFLLFGGFCFATSLTSVAIEKFIPTHAKVSVSFSPQFAVIDVPDPEIRYGGKSYEQDTAIDVRDDGTIRIIVDRTIQTYRSLRAANTSAQASIENLRRVVVSSPTGVGDIFGGNHSVLPKLPSDLTQDGLSSSHGRDNAEFGVGGGATTETAKKKQLVNQLDSVLNTLKEPL